MRDWLVLQLADATFPAGGFAHSGGLEAAIQHGHVADAAGVRAFARHALVQAGRGGVPLVTAVHRDPRRLAELDRFCDAFLTNPVPATADYLATFQFEIKSTGNGVAPADGLAFVVQGVGPDQVGDALKQATSSNKPTILEIMATQELGDPFRRDALKKPVRMLDKYKAYTVA